MASRSTKPAKRTVVEALAADDFKGITVPDLKTELGRRNLAKSGRRADLIARLRGVVPKTTAPKPEASGKGKSGERPRTASPIPAPTQGEKDRAARYLALLAPIIKEIARREMELATGVFDDVVKHLRGAHEALEKITGPDGDSSESNDGADDEPLRSRKPSLKRGLDDEDDAESDAGPARKKPTSKPSGGSRGRRASGRSRDEDRELPTSGTEWETPSPIGRAVETEAANHEGSEEGEILE